MRNAILSKNLRGAVPCAALLCVSLAYPHAATAQEKAKKPLVDLSAGGEATLEADQQKGVGKIYYADGHVDVRYQNSRLRADHVEYDSENQIVTARGHVQLDYMTQHVEADDARYELKTGKGTFHNARGTFALQRRPSATLLISPNPLYFNAEQADRLDEDTYLIHRAWITVCDPSKPTWKFYAPKATIRVKKTVHLENGNFRIHSIPVLYLPYTSFPAEQRRTSGFMIPDVGDTTQKGFVFGDSLYWAPLDWMDVSLGASLYSSRGWAQKGQIRMRPWENANLEASYYGVIDRGLPQVDAPPLKQGGHESKLLFTSLLPDGWRVVGDLDELTSLTFRLAWSETYKEAVNSEVHNTAYLINNFNGFSLSFAALSYQNYLDATSATSITLRTAPVLDFSSVDQAWFPKLPVYFSFDSFVGAESRTENVTPFHTPPFVERSEIAPSVAIPLHFGPWLDITPSFTFRSTYYGGQLRDDAFLAQGLFRDTEEFALDMRLPVFERVWGEDSETKWKHVIEPYITYRFVNGVNDFGRFLRFDQDDTLTDTNEVELGVTQRLFRRRKAGGTEELITWRLAAKYFFDPTFGGALVPGQPNVFQTLDTFTPFAFADQPRRWSPIVSDIQYDPGKRFDTEFIINYDPQRNRMTAIGTLLKIKPYKESFLTLSHFSILNLPLNPIPPPLDFQQRSNQIRALIGYGDPNRRGWNVMYGTSYDFTQQEFQNQIAEFAYNGSCCGFGFEYRRFSFGTIRNENQYSVVFRIANIGSAGNMRKQEKIF